MSSNEDATTESAADISNLQENFSKQQKKISALKELVRKSEAAHGKSTSSAQEKVKNIAQRLTHLKSKARSRQSLDVPSSKLDTTTGAAGEEPHQHSLPQLHYSIKTPTSSNASTPNPTPLRPHQQQQQQHQYQHSGSNTSMPILTTSCSVGTEKILLLRQQMEENKARMALRASSKQHLEQLVTQLKEKFDSTQQYLEDTSELGKSMTDLSALSYMPMATTTTTTRERHRSATDLTTQPFSLEKERIKFLENRCRLLEKQLEKERLTKSGRDTSSQSDSVPSTTQATSKLIKELENKVLELDEALTERQNEIELKTKAEQDLLAENKLLGIEIVEKMAEIEKLRSGENVMPSNDDYYSETNDFETENERLRNELAEKEKRIAELEEINDMLETTRCDLTSKNNENEEHIQQLQQDLSAANEKLQRAQEDFRQSRTKSLKDEVNVKQTGASAAAAADTETQVQMEMAKEIQTLQTELQAVKEENAKLRAKVVDTEKLEVTDVDIADKIIALEATIESQRDDLKQRMEALSKYEEELMEKTIELNVLNANFKAMEEKLQGNSKNKPLFAGGDSSDAESAELQAEIKQLKQKLDESNKAMIKLKLKCKQSEKQIEKLKKNSDLHAELVKLERQNADLQQKVDELDDLKGQQWQVVDDEKLSDSELSKAQAETIRLLEQQKFEQADKLEKVCLELQCLEKELKRERNDESERVKSEMSEIHLEEQLEEQAQELKLLQEKLAIKQQQFEEQNDKLQALEAEKQAVDKKLNHYIAENMELLEKVEKISKSSSSAESIEIVERLTQQERAELEEYNKRHEHEHEHELEQHTELPISSVSELTQTEMGPELTESLVKLREESSELMNKIALFTAERREVLEKMEQLTADNQELVRKIEELTQEKELMDTNALLAENAKSKLEAKLQDLTKEKELLASQVAESTAQKAQLSQELSHLQKSSEVVAALDSSEAPTLFDKCEKSLSKLNNELVSYSKANDKNAKFNASKKLAKEAKNAYTQLSELLQKVKESSTAVETVTVVETVVAVTAPNGKALAEYEQLTAQNRALHATVAELRRELEQLSQEDAEPGNNGGGGVTITEVRPAITQNQFDTTQVQLKAAQDTVDKFEERCITLQTTVENLRLQLQETRLAGDEKSLENTQLKEELASMQKLNDDFDRLLNEKELSHEKHLEQLTRLRRELEGKCETYEGEMEILQTLVTEQKQQLIESYKENEHEINLKLLDLQQRDEQITQLRQEIKALKEATAAAGEELSINLQSECEKLRESMKINKTLVAEQVNELTNKQETIETLNQQIIDLYKAMEENTNKVIEKEDEIAYVQELLNTNSEELERLRKDNNEQKSVVDKLLNELHSHKASMQNMPQLESDLQRLESANKDLEQRAKEQLEKMKKYAANLKKRTAQCHEYELKIKQLEEKGTVEAMESKAAEHKDSNALNLEEFKTNNVLLNERMNELELQQKDKDAELTEIKEALQLKTGELLESMENSRKLENNLKQVRESLEKATQETMQLQNALAASQEQTSDWGDFLVESSSISSNEHIVNELKEKVNSLEENLNQKSKEITEMQEQLRVAKEQSSDWGEDFNVVDNSNNESDELRKELLVKTTNLTATEAALNELQAELLQIREIEKEKEQSELELSTELKQQTTANVELQKQLATYENNIQTLHQQIGEKDKRLTEVSEELKAKALKFEKSKAVIKERNNQIHRLQTQLKDLQDKLSAQPEEVEEAPVEHKVVQLQLSAAPTASQQVSKEEYESIKQSYDKLNAKYTTEKSNFEETIARLETLHDGIQAKLQEDLSYIETLEQENAKFKDKICKLEECVASFEERRASMERRVHFLDEQMQTRVDAYVKTEDELIYRLNMLSDHDDIIAQRLVSSQEEKESLQEKLDAVQFELSELNTKYGKLEKEHHTQVDNLTNNLESENMILREKIAAAETELNHQRSALEARLAAKTSEIDELECELNDQLQKINVEKRTLRENLERSRDECTLHKDEIVRLKESLNALEQSKLELEREVTWLRMQNENAEQDQYELQEVRMQSLQDKTEIDNLRHQIETLSANHEIELQALRTQIAELDTLRMQVGQNQTDDQVFIETENKRLTDLLAEKELVIANYQRQNLQLQMTPPAPLSSATSTTQAQPDPLAIALGLTPDPMSQPQSQQYSERERLQRDLNALQTELQLLLDSNSELQRQLLEKNQELERIRHSPSRSAAAAFTNDVIPAPPMFFASEQMTSSPFDEIVQMRVHENTLEAAPLMPPIGSDNIIGEQPTIEDLQRNVSDLEKHAHELENKLATRNQRETDYEEKLREIQARENRMREREQQFQAMQMEIQKVTEENHIQKQQYSDMQHNLETLQWQLTNAEQQMQERVEKDLNIKLATHSQLEADYEQKLRELRARLGETENNAREREEQLQTTQIEYQKLFDENFKQKQQQIETQQSLESLQWQLNNVEQQLRERSEQLNEMQVKWSFSNESTIQLESQGLQNRLLELEQTLQQRDNELNELRNRQSEEQHLKQTASTLERQIIPDPIAPTTQTDGGNAKDVGPTLDMFFGNSSAPEFESLIIPPVSNQPVVEDVIVPEKSYLCYPGSENATSENVSLPALGPAPSVSELDLGDDWDGDTWGGKEAEAEAKHFATTTQAASGVRTSLIPREQQLELHLQEASERIQELEIACERSEQQKQELQVKSGKLMKKLKEYKSKLDEMQASNVFRKSTSVESNSMFGDLDAAIQDELKTQIKLLEAKLEEHQKTHENFTLEKEKLLKRIDVLTAGNDRMSEMKERQDMDVRMYQARIRELQEKLNSLDDWDVAEKSSKEHMVKESVPTFESAAIPNQQQQELEKKITDLTAELQDITGDRQELQALLEDEKANVARAEETVRTLQQLISSAAGAESAEKSKYNELKLEYQNLQERYNTVYEHNEKVSVQFKTLQADHERLLQQEQQSKVVDQSENQTAEIKNLRVALENMESQSNELQMELLEIRSRNQELQQTNEELNAGCKTGDEVGALKQELEQLRSSKAQLEQQVTVLQSEIMHLQLLLTATTTQDSNAASTITTTTRDDELSALLQEKESEIMHLKQRVEDLMREDQTEKLVLEILTKNQEIHMLKMQVKHLKDDKHELENNLSVQITKELHSTNTDVDETSCSTQLQKQNKQLLSELKELQEEKVNMEEELKVLNNHVMSTLELEDKMKVTTLELDTKNIEIAELRKSLETAKNYRAKMSTVEESNAVAQVDFVALNTQWESIVEQRCGEIAQMWREHLEKREVEFRTIEARLNEENAALRTSANTAAIVQAQQQHQSSQMVSAETPATSTPASESTSMSHTSSATPSKEGTPLRRARIIDEENEADADDIIEKMQAALESQEVEIVTLKEQLAIRSAEYARLAAQYDPFKLQTTLSHSGVMQSPASISPDAVQTRRTSTNASGNENSSVVPKSELDLALYMLHQRDMRCEEMTVELVSLLEERDTLQLKLSNTLRQVESIKAQTNYVEPPAAQSYDNTSTSSSSVDNSASLPVAGSPAAVLNQKLSELHTVNHSKDKVIKEERDERIRQMERIQQDVAKMPPAALSEIIGSDLSQSNQSPSSTLLNWLWGNNKSNPNSAGGNLPN